MRCCKRINISSSLDLLISFDVLSALLALICKYFEIMVIILFYYYNLTVLSLHDNVENSV